MTVGRLETATRRGLSDRVLKPLHRPTVSALPSDSLIRQQVIEELMRQIMHYDAEFRHEDATFAVGSREALTAVRVRLEHGDQFDPRATPEGQGGQSIASFERCRHVGFTPNSGRMTATQQIDALGQKLAETA